MVSSFLGSAVIPVLLIISAVVFVVVAGLQLTCVRAKPKRKTAFIIRLGGFLLLAVAIVSPIINFISNLTAAIITVISAVLVLLSYLLKKGSQASSKDLPAKSPAENSSIDNKAVSPKPKPFDVPPLKSDVNKQSSEIQQPVKAVVTPAQATRSAIKKETGLRAEPLVRLPAQRRKKARALVNTLVGFVVFFLVGWGSYTVAKRIIKPESEMDNLTPQIDEDVSSPIFQDSELQAPEESQPTQPSPSEEPVVEETPEEEEEVKQEPEKTVLIKDTETGFLNVREGASTATAIVTKIDPGDTYEFLEETETGNWYKIQVDDETAGWISAKYADKNE